MGVLLKIAFRNLREHKAKTLIIGSLVAFGLVVLVAGNALLETAERGIRRMYTESFTGQVMIASARSRKPSLFLSPESVNGDRLPILGEYPRLEDYLKTLSGVRSMVPQLNGIAVAEIQGEGKSLVQFFSAPPEAYLAMFPDTIQLLEGDFLAEQEPGIVLSEEVARELEQGSGLEVAPGRRILLTNLSSSFGAKIREVEVKGIFRFAARSPNLSRISYLDLNSARILSGLTRRTDPGADLTGEERRALGSVDEEQLFAEGASLVAAAGSGTRAYSAEKLSGILGDTSQTRLYRELDGQAWHYVLLKLEPGRSAKAAIRSLNRDFQDLGLPLRAYGWVEAAGGVAQMVSALKILFYALILVVAVVAVIIIMNTLIISITERIAEIGTMRAIGAGRGFVRAMLTLETLLISVVFGLAGMALGAGLIGILGRTGIRASGLFLQVLFGGPLLEPVLSAGSLAGSLLVVVAVGLLASLYPAAVALRIEPVRAMGQR